MSRLVATILILLGAALAAAPHAQARPGEDGSLTVLFFNRPPYYVKAPGKPGGFLMEYARAVLEKAGVEHVFEEMPSKRILEMFQAPTSPAVSVGWFKTPERERFARFSLPIYQDKPMVAVFAAGGKRPPAGIRTFTALSARQDLTLGMVDSFSYGPAVDALVAAMPARPLKVAATQEQMLRMLAAGRFDFLLMQPEEVDVLAELAGVPAQDLTRLELVDLPKGNERHLMFNALTPAETIERVNAAIRSLPTAP